VLSFASSIPALLVGAAALILGVLSVRKAVLQWPLIWNEELVEDAGTRSMVAAYFLYHVLVSSFVALFLTLNIVGNFEQSAHPFVWPLATLVLLLALFVGRAFDKAQNTSSADEPELLYFVRYCQYLIEQRRAKAAAELARVQVPAEYCTPREVSARSILPSMRYIRLKFGEPKLHEMLSELKMPMDYVKYHESPLSLKFVDSFMRRLISMEGGDPKSVFRAQSCGGNMECMGAVFFVLARVFSVRAVYELFVRITDRFDRLCSYRIVSSDKRNLTLEVKVRDTKKVSSSLDYGLFSVAGWFSAIPNLKGLPSARIRIVSGFEAVSQTGAKEPNSAAVLEILWFDSIDEFNASHISEISLV
jgi:hypothetical protein